MGKKVFMKDTLITILRDEASSAGDYRRTTKKLGSLLAGEVANFIPKTSYIVNTPLGPARGAAFAFRIILVPILRAGISLLYPFLDYFDEAKIGFIGIKRDEITSIPHSYYQNLPAIHEKDEVIVLDPMIATGGSACLALKLLKEQGIKEEKISLVAIIAAPEGLHRLKTNFPEVRVHVAQVDDKLNSQNYIVPGLGDFGDRYCGTEKIEYV